MTIEHLESRIAPASVVNLIDSNGDHIKFTASHGDLLGKIASGQGFDANHRIYFVNLTDAAFDSADFSVTVKKAGGGDGVVDVGYIFAGTNNLGKVSVAGNLGHIDAGHGSATVAAIKSLTVGSLGRFGLLGYSTITGTLGRLKVKGDVFCKQFTATQDIQSVTIGGSLVGGDGQNDGEIFAARNLLQATIGGDVGGGKGDFSGQLGAGMDMGKVTIKGSLIGGSGAYSGVIGAFDFHSATTFTTSFGTITIRQDIVGGTGSDSGSVYVTGTLDNLTLRGSLYGGGGSSSTEGIIDIEGHAGSVFIGGNVYGGSGTFAGYIYAGSGLDRLTIKGSLFGSSGDRSGAIFMTGALGLLKIGHDIRGASGFNSAEVYIPDGITKQIVGGLVIPGTGIDSGKIG